MSRWFVIALYLLLVAGLLSLTGCAATAPQTVLVPTVSPCPAAAADKRPAKPSKTLDHLDASKPAAVARAYATSRAQWQGYAEALDNLLDACK